MDTIDARACMEILMLVMRKEVIFSYFIKANCKYAAESKNCTVTELEITSDQRVEENRL